MKRRGGLRTSCYEGNEMNLTTKRLIGGNFSFLSKALIVTRLHRINKAHNLPYIFLYSAATPACTAW